MCPEAVHAVIAVKYLEHAKSRLADRLPPGDRSVLVLAMLSDTVCAALTAGLASVTVVTPDPTVAAAVRALGAEVRPDPATPGDRDGLNTALSAAAAAVRELHGPVSLLALQADLPALRPAELTDVLLAAPPRGRALVVDHAGEGTTALLVRDGTAPLAPLFGAGSARRHIDSGAKDLAGEWPGLRLDVDTAADLAAAQALGVGPATARVLHDIGWSPVVGEDVIRKYQLRSHVC
ncbi:2-phospho-L-lactate guanylyltransferase [Nocardia sp. alder85J]|uniref:2-phospho-L-lactate guanylyltransferase n=1 Tax=Nocardia sp. alder85J TaxID=2862949 RepID=UPI001CD369F2|nr:2-phospho-L-lactate guanylyltransferase [Nocardia sp. alder85J]MCX4094012.1 2-phospho-L-lactate guanylyltransferase [Nocardia sp. alder85J]